MTRRPPIRQSDIQRAIRAAQAAGLPIAGVEVDPRSGVFRILTSSAPSDDADEMERRMIQAFGR